MKILWMTWKDRKHPRAGGAEMVNEELAKRLVADGHEVIFLVGGFPGANSEEVVDGYRIIRVGNKYSAYWRAYRYYIRHLRGWADLVIEEVNTVPFFTRFYVKERIVLFIHMLCGKIWFYQMVFPMSLLGYIGEPIYLRLLNNHEVITISESTKRDLKRAGFKENNIKIISEGIEFEPIENLPPLSNKFQKPTILSLGSIRSMKRTLHQLRAYELAKKTIPELEFIITGDNTGRYGKKFTNAIKKSPFKSSIRYYGKVTKEMKIELLRQCHLVLQTSVKEGWGLTVTEAASQGTPAVVYDVDGLRDSVQPNKTGVITNENTTQELAENITKLLTDENTYTILRNETWQWSKEINFNRSYHEFLEAIQV